MSKPQWSLHTYYVPHNIFVGVCSLNLLSKSSQALPFKFTWNLRGPHILAMSQVKCIIFPNPSVQKAVAKGGFIPLSQSKPDQEPKITLIFLKTCSLDKFCLPYFFNKEPKNLAQIEQPNTPRKYWVFPKIMVPQNGWFIMENPIKMDDFGGPTPIFGNTHIYIYISIDFQILCD